MNRGNLLMRGIPKLNPYWQQSKIAAYLIIFDVNALGIGRYANKRLCFCDIALFFY